MQNIVVKVSRKKGVMTIIFLQRKIQNKPVYKHEDVAYDNADIKISTKYHKIEIFNDAQQTKQIF